MKKNLFCGALLTALVTISSSASAFQLYIKEWKNDTYGTYYISKAEGAHGDGIKFHGANCDSGWSETFNHKNTIKMCGKGHMESAGFAVPWYDELSQKDTFLKIEHHSKPFRLTIVDCKPGGELHRCLSVRQGWGAHTVVGPFVALVKGGQLNTPCEIDIKLTVTKDHSFDFDILPGSTGACAFVSTAHQQLDKLTEAIATAYAGS